MVEDIGHRDPCSFDAWLTAALAWLDGDDASPVHGMQSGFESVASRQGNLTWVSGRRFFIADEACSGPAAKAVRFWTAVLLHRFAR